jgi:hypothetical protein
LFEGKLRKLWSKRKGDTTHDHPSDDISPITQLGNKRKRDARSGDEEGVDQDKPVTKKRDVQNKGLVKENVSDSEQPKAKAR